MSNDLREIFSRHIRVGGIGATAVEREITATQAECKALAASFGLPGIAELTGDFTLTAAKVQGGILDAELRLHARVTQICVISLEPFETIVTEAATLRFVSAASMAEDADIAELNPETLEGPDEIPYTGDIIDLGAALAEQLALTLDPYPRKPGAQLPAQAVDRVGNPFATLAPLQKRAGP